MKKIGFALFIFVFMGVSFACEPKAFDFNLFMEVNDANGDGYLSWDELKNADMNRDYNNSLTKPVNTVEAFNELDKNGDKKLSKEELWQWGKHNFNGCAGFPELD
jgi:Ca2+-binding EF-hand superfamily protein